MTKELHQLIAEKISKNMKGHWNNVVDENEFIQAATKVRLNKKEARIAEKELERMGLIQRKNKRKIELKKNKKGIQKVQFQFLFYTSLWLVITILYYTFINPTL